MINKPKTLESTVTDVKTTATQSFDKTMDSLKQNTATATAGIEHAQAEAQTKMKDGVTRAMKTAEQMAHFSQGNMEAVMKSSQILATGLTDISKLWAEHARASFEESMATLKAMTSVKSVKEAVDMQTSFARASMEKAMAETGRMTEHSLKLAEQAAAPLTARMNVAVETFSAHH